MPLIYCPQMRWRTHMTDIEKVGISDHYDVFGTNIRFDLIEIYVTLNQSPSPESKHSDTEISARLLK